jgi:hypothetical protein
MHSIRFITAAAVLVMAMSTAMNTATAQTATEEAPGKPLSLLQILHAKTTTAKPTAAPHAIVAKRLRQTRLSRHFAHHAARVAAAEPRPEPDAANEQAQTNEQAQWSAQAALAPVPASTWPSGDVPDPVAQASAAAAPSLSELVVNGRTVQIAAPDEVNAIDLAADNAASAPSQSFVAFAQRDDSRDAWYEELLTTLGGALAAGLVAWFLIFGATPQRVYG